MKIAVFSDIHGNTVYFQAVLSRLEGKSVDRMFFLGDSVSYCPFGNDVLTMLRERNITCIEGNHDSMARGEFPIPERKDAIYRLRETIETITPENMAFLKSWPDSLSLEADGRRMFFVHGSPLNHLKGYAYEDSEMYFYDDPETDAVFMGHTHRPWMKQNEHTLLVNVGSVGLPRDRGRFPTFVLYDTLTGEVSIERFEADPTPLLRNPGILHPDTANVFNRGKLWNKFA